MPRRDSPVDSLCLFVGTKNLTENDKAYGTNSQPYLKGEVTLCLEMLMSAPRGRGMCL